MKIGLVFSGGGGKGSYQIGVWQAIDDLGLTQYIKGISATSIGTINLMFFINKDINCAIRFWENIRRKDIAPIQLNLFKMIYQRSLSQKQNLRNIIEDNIDFTKLNNSEIELIAMCTQVYMGYPKKRIFKLNYKSKEEAIDIILSSCSIPFLYRAQKIQSYPMSYFYDGGIMSRTPVEGLNYNDYDKIIVVHLDNLNKFNLIKYNKEKYINIYPSIYQGGLYKGTYGFTKKLAKKRIEVGYLDTIKKLTNLNYLIKVSEVSDEKNKIHKYNIGNI